MTATITIDGRPATTHDDNLVRDVADAVAVGDTTRQFRMPRPSPNGRRRVLVFTAAQVDAINARGIALADPRPVVAA